MSRWRNKKFTSMPERNHVLPIIFSPHVVCDFRWLHKVIIYRVACSGFYFIFFFGMLFQFAFVFTPSPLKRISKYNKQWWILKSWLLVLNTERSYITGVRCSACQSQIPTDDQCSLLIGLFTQVLFLASCRVAELLFLCRFSAVEK